MKITFLGTASSKGVPIIGCKCGVCNSKNKKDNRFRSSVLLEINGENHLIDCGPDFRQQALLFGIKKIKSVFFTHEHSDHTSGIDDIRPISQKQEKNINIYTISRVSNDLKDRFKYIFVNKYFGAPSFKINNIDFDKSFFVGKNEVIPIEISHGNLTIAGYRLRDFAYLTDVKTISDKEIDKLKNLELLIISCFERVGNHPAHANLDEILEIIAKISPKKTYLTHMSHKIGLFNETEKILPPNVNLAYDGLILDV